MRQIQNPYNLWHFVQMKTYMTMWHVKWSKACMALNPQYDLDQICTKKTHQSDNHEPRVLG